MGARKQEKERDVRARARVFWKGEVAEQSVKRSGSEVS